jgi:hypothetical protein
MNNLNRRKFFRSGLLVAAAGLTGAWRAKAAANEFDTLVQSGAISKESLQFIREEEKLARDVYIGLYRRWGTRVFDNISRSEQTHTDKIKYLLNKYKLEDPAANTGIGVFKNPTIQKLYNDLMVRGSKSQQEALYVGAYIEELDIGDLRHEIADSSSKDVIQVYTNLMEGSYNHLRAFVSQIERRGAPYKAQLLTQEDLNNILGR